MKRFTISALSTAIIAALAATSAQAESFVDESKLNIHLRNYYKDQDYNKWNDGIAANKTEEDSAWTQAFRADFESGYFADLVGVDFSAHYALKIDEDRGDDRDSGTGLLNKNSSNKGNSYGKVFGAVKVNLMDQGVAKYGRMRIDTPLLNDDDSRSLPSTVEALYADYSMAGLTAYGASASKHNFKYESGYDNYGYGTNKDSVDTIGAKYSMDGISATLAYGNQTDYVTQFYADAAYTFPIDDSMSVKLGAQYGNRAAKGDYKDFLKGNLLPGQSLVDDIDWWGTMAALNMGHMDLSISFTSVEQVSKGTKEGLKSATHAWAVQGGAEDSTQFAGYNSVQIDDFNAAGEQSIQYKIAYDFSEMVEGLSAYALYVDGTLREDGKDPSTSEYNVRVDYELPFLEGLTLTLRHAKYKGRAQTSIPIQAMMTGIKLWKIPALL